MIPFFLTSDVLRYNVILLTSWDSVGAILPTVTIHEWNMSRLQEFNDKQVQILGHTVEIAEDVTSNYYKMSFNEWKRHRYDIKTLVHLNEDEITREALAQITRYTKNPNQKLRGSQHFDYYKICLQDHVILDALLRESALKLLPLAAYIVTHELIHVIRFSKFLQNFHASPSERMKEEVRVHATTSKILSKMKLPDLGYVINLYHALGQIEKFSEY